DRVDEQRGGRSAQVWARVREPPVFGREADDVDLALLVEDVAAQTADGHEDHETGGVAGALEDLALHQVARGEETTDELDLGRRQRGPRREVGAQALERGGGARRRHAREDYHRPRERFGDRTAGGENVRRRLLVTPSGSEVLGVHVHGD